MTKYQAKTITKCNFCQWFQGNTCVRATDTGHVNSYYCYDAEKEFKQWQYSQQKKNIKNC